MRNTIFIFATDNEITHNDNTIGLFYYGLK